MWVCILRSDFQGVTLFPIRPYFTGSVTIWIFFPIKELLAYLGCCMHLCSDRRCYGLLDDVSLIQNIPLWKVKVVAVLSKMSVSGMFLNVIVLVVLAWTILIESWISFSTFHMHEILALFNTCHSRSLSQAYAVKPSCLDTISWPKISVEPSQLDTHCIWPLRHMLSKLLTPYTCSFTLLSSNMSTWYLLFSVI